MSAAARFLVFLLCAVKISSFRFEGLARADVVVVGRDWASKELRWEVKEREVEEEISCFGGRVGRGTPYREEVSAGMLARLDEVLKFGCCFGIESSGAGIFKPVQFW